MPNNSRTRRPRAAQVTEKILHPLESFFKLETASGIILMIVTLIAVIWANSPWGLLYEHLIETPFSFGIGDFTMTKSFHHWVNDGLMVIFFFMVGLEIKRELAIGELSTPKKAILPMVAALGGMIAPALLYASINWGTPGIHGWGIPMATDIAFAIGILSLMSRKVPFALKVFLLALAIVDDLGAILVIALFYTEEIATSYLAIAAVTFFITLFVKYIGIRKLPIYVLLGVIAWFAVLQSGIHATVAGVLLGLMTPVIPFLDKKLLPDKAKKLIDDISVDIHDDDEELHLSEATTHKLDHLNSLVIEAKSPLDRLIHALHPWVSYLIMPVFAFTNAGVHLTDVDFSAFVVSPVALGVILGLFIGKPLGVVLLSWLAVKLNIASLPRGVTWRHMTAMGFLAGIGFTMALFITHLALKNPELEVAKLAVLVGSLLAGILGAGILAMGKDAGASSSSPEPEQYPGTGH